MLRIGKKNARIDEFGTALATELSKRVPLQTDARSAKKKGNEKYVKAIEHALDQTVTFQRENKLGIYGKARLFNAFKWELKRLGYPEDFIDGATAAIMNFAAARPARP
jgi:hypothetical protein